MLLRFVKGYQTAKLLVKPWPYTTRNCLSHIIKQLGTMSAGLNSIKKVDIDPAGVYKYILIKVHDSNAEAETSVTIVRGYAKCEYHADILDLVQENIKDYDCECIGGGRISHQPNEKKIHIYGYSQGYGKADHEITAKLVKDAFPGYTVSISDEGY